MTVNDLLVRQLDAKACREWEQVNRVEDYLWSVLERRRQQLLEIKKLATARAKSARATVKPKPKPKPKPQPSPVLLRERYEAEQRRWMQILWGRPAMTPRETIVFTVPHNF
jgi:hypothetical protein